MIFQLQAANIEKEKNYRLENYNQILANISAFHLESLSFINI